MPHVTNNRRFQLPRYKWDTMTVNQDAQDKEIQRAVMEVVTANSMVQIHEQSTGYSTDDKVISHLVIKQRPRDI